MIYLTKNMKKTDSFIYKSTCGIQRFIQINDNVILNSRECNIKITKGGFINITNPNNLYGISKRNF